MKLTSAQINQGIRRAESLRSRMANLKKKTEKVTERAVHTLEAGASAFGFGVLHGRSADPDGVQLVGIPVELVAGVGLHAAGFLGLGGKMSSHLHGFADGAIASYATRMGYTLGTKWKESGGGTGILESQRRNKYVGQGADVLSDEELVKAGSMVAAG